MNRTNLIKSIKLFTGLVCCVLANNHNCTLPKNCFIERVKYDANEFNYEKNTFPLEYKAVKCIIRDSANKFEFEFNNITKISSNRVE